MKRMDAKLWGGYVVLFVFILFFLQSAAGISVGVNIKCLLFQSQPGTAINKIKTHRA